MWIGMLHVDGDDGNKSGDVECSEDRKMMKMLGMKMKMLEEM